MRTDEIIPDCDLTADELYFWWKCLRKRSYSTKNEAMKIIAEYDDEGRLNAYHCGYCENWHNGQISSKKNASLSKVRRNWRNRNVKPQIDTVIAYWSNPKQMSLVFWGDFERNNA